MGGSASGRAFEDPLTLFVWGGLTVAAIALWLWGRYEIRRYHDKPKSDEDEID
ncbi:MAG: hypothetical protein QNI90_12505 [Dinoroseobacter sp.]|nr:hypothetical protein [Dinoroseobacter sp.]